MISGRLSVVGGQNIKPRPVVAQNPALAGSNTQAETICAMLQQITRPAATKGTDANERAARPELDQTTTLAAADISGEMVVHWQSGKGK
jgi:hypothetical protein